VNDPSIHAVVSVVDRILGQHFSKFYNKHLSYRRHFLDFTAWGSINDGADGLSDVRRAFLGDLDNSEAGQDQLAEEF